MSLSPDPPEPPDDDQRRRLKRRLIERIADDEPRLRSVEPASAAWQPFAEGVEILPLHRDGPAMSYLLRLAPGASLPPHRHRLDEECVVLEGRLRIGRQAELGRCGYHLAPSGALHASLHTDTGALIFLRGAVPRPDDVLG